MRRALGFGDSRRGKTLDQRRAIENSVRIQKPPNPLAKLLASVERFHCHAKGKVHRHTPPEKHVQILVEGSPVLCHDLAVVKTELEPRELVLDALQFLADLASRSREVGAEGDGKGDRRARVHFYVVRTRSRIVGGDLRDSRCNRKMLEVVPELPKPFLVLAGG